MQKFSGTNLGVGFPSKRKSVLFIHLSLQVHGDNKYTKVCRVFYRPRNIHYTKGIFAEVKTKGNLHTILKGEAECKAIIWAKQSYKQIYTKLQFMLLYQTAVLTYMAKYLVPCMFSIRTKIQTLFSFYPLFLSYRNIGGLNILSWVSIWVKNSLLEPEDQTWIP